MRSARANLVDAVGPEGLVDAAAVVGNRERMNRISLAAGLQMDAPLRILSAGIRDELSLHDLPSAEGSNPGAAAQFLARYAMPVVTKFVSMLNR